MNLMNRKMLSALALSASLVSVAASANQAPDMAPPVAGSPQVSSQSVSGKVTINNRAYLVESTAPQPQKATRSPSQFQANGSAPAALTKGMHIKNITTGSLAKVTGRFSVLLNPGVDAQKFAQQHGLSIYKRMGKSRLYIFEAADQADILSVDEALQDASDASAVKVELLENLMKPF